jgi:Tol biopolymer transport system component/predicted Ser/Thr protein kinase
MTPERWRRIQGYYLAAIDLKEEERAAVLASAPPDVRAEVEAMLAQSSVPDSLSHPAWEQLDTSDSAPITPGAEFAQYKIESEIGAGGMGVVFRAQDTRLHRPVAIKFLSSAVADAAARRRFQREAQMASSLNHPHILTVHDIGEYLDREYLVTEFIDGGTLKDWIRQRPRNWQEIAELLTGVADGLATAHQAGILHRDIKPENILVTASGYAKLADFGLAKLQDPPAAATRTLTANSTLRGMIVGTIAYMSPEQASGKTLDARSDIFSFGVVLYEMLAGERPFRAKGNMELLQQVIEREPAPLSEAIPQALQAVVNKALRKNPADRYSSMTEMVAALREIQRSGQAVPVATPKRRRQWLAVASAAAIVAAALAGVWWFRPRQAASGQRLEYVALTNFSDSAVSPTLSTDGRMLAFIRGANTFTGPGDVYVKLLPDGDPVRLTTDDGEKMGPLNFSADGSRIAYTSGGWNTWSVPVLGGAPTPLLANTEGLSWTDRRHVMFSALIGEGLRMGVFEATESRSEQRTVYLSPGGMAHRSFLSPDGKSVIVIEMDDTGWLPCRVVPFNGSSPGKRVGPDPSQCTDAAWTPDGRWMYVSANTGSGFHIWRQRFPDGTPKQVTFGATEEQGLSFAADGRSFVTSVGESQSTLWIHDTHGERQITFEGYAYLPSFSADASRIYYLLRTNGYRRFVSGELWSMDLRSGSTQRLLPGLLVEHYDISPDGKRVVFVNVDNSGHAQLWIGTTDGSVPPRVLVNQDCRRALFTPGDDIVFVGGERVLKMYFQIVHADGSGLRQIAPESATYLYDISPDGKWVSVWMGPDIKAYPLNGGEPVTICRGCGSTGAEERGVTPPRVSWSRDGRELYLHSEQTRQTYAVPLKPGQILPPIPASGLNWRSGAPPIPGTRTIPQRRPFMSPKPQVYAYPQVSTHRNIYRVPVP